MRFSSSITLPQARGIRERPITLELMDYSSACSDFAKITLPAKAGVRKREFSLEVTVAALPDSVAKITLPQSRGVRERAITLELLPIGLCAQGVSWCTCFTGSISGEAGFDEFSQTIDFEISGQDVGTQPPPTSGAVYYDSLLSETHRFTLQKNFTFYRDPSQDHKLDMFFNETKTVSGVVGSSTSSRNSTLSAVVYKKTETKIRQRGNMFYGKAWWLGSALEMPEEKQGLRLLPGSLRTLNDYYYSGIVPGMEDRLYTEDPDQYGPNKQTSAGTYRESKFLTELSDEDDTTKQYRVDGEILDLFAIVQICDFYSPADVFIDGERVESPKFSKTVKYLQGEGVQVEYEDGVPYVDNNPGQNFRVYLDLLGIEGSTSFYKNLYRRTQEITMQKVQGSWRTWKNAEVTQRISGSPGPDDVNLSSFRTHFPNVSGNPSVGNFLIPVTENTWYFTLELGIHEGPVYDKELKEFYKTGTFDDDGYSNNRPWIEEVEVNVLSGTRYGPVTQNMEEPHWYAGWGLYLKCSSDGRSYGPYMVSDHLKKYIQQDRLSPYTRIFSYNFKEEDIDTTVEADVEKLEELIKDFNLTPQEVSFQKPQTKSLVSGPVFQADLGYDAHIPWSRPRKLKSVGWQKYHDMDSWINGHPFGLSISKGTCKKMPEGEFPYLKIFAWIMDPDGDRYGGTAYFVLDWSFEEGKWVGQQNRIGKQKRIWNGSWTETEPETSKIELSKESNREWKLEWKKVEPLKQIETYRVIYQHGYGLKDENDNDITLPDSTTIVYDNRSNPQGNWHVGADSSQPLVFSISAVPPTCPEYNDQALCPPALARNKSE